MSKAPVIRRAGWFEIAFSAVLVFNGVLFFIDPGTSSVLDILVPQRVQNTWMALFLAGGLLAVVGALWPVVEKGVLVERAGMLFMGSGFLLYTVTLLQVFGFSSARNGILLGIGLTLAALGRWDQIRRDVKKYKQLSQKPLVAHITVVPVEEDTLNG